MLLADDLGLGSHQLAHGEQLFADSGLQGHEEALKTLSQQLTAYTDWVRETMLLMAAVHAAGAPETHASLPILAIS